MPAVRRTHANRVLRLNHILRDFPHLVVAALHAGEVVLNDLFTALAEVLAQRFLDAFFEEEFNDDDDPLASEQRRPMIPRRKIRAYLANIGTPGLNPSDVNELGRTISKAYSGYVHAAAPHIMEMYGGEPPKFHLAGMLGTPRIEEHTADLWNYLYRGLLAFLGAAYAFQDIELAKRLERFRDWLESKISGLV